ncbi:MAG TPA: formyltransferase family protein [Bacteroidia bacterium]|jgi:folate-dependent phosphoribosylglycinamide formyltransferase PurN|nr:formyltransferase family protein [Bacteroidia bacterium]
MKIGLTTYSFDNKDFREQLSSMLKNGIKPDYILLHYGGKFKYNKGFNFLRKTLKQQRFKSLPFLLSYKKNKPSAPAKFKLSESDSKEVDNYISLANIINAKGINAPYTINKIRSLGVTMIACNGGRLHSDVLNISTAVFLNVHASKLPMYRGMNNVEWALWEHNEIYGTIHKISIGIDEGDILYQEKIDTSNIELKTISDYRQYCFFKSNEMMGMAIKDYFDKKLSFTKQDAPRAPIAQYYIMHPILKEYLQKRLAQK